MFRIIGETNLDFIGARKFSFVFSPALIPVGLIALVMVVTGKANLGIDFAGGTMIYGTFENEVAIDDLRTAISVDFPAATITELSDFEKPNAFIVKVKRPESEADSRDRSEQLKEVIVAAFEGNQFTVESEHFIGPAVGKSLSNHSQMRVLVSLFCIFF